MKALGLFTGGSPGLGRLGDVWSDPNWSGDSGIWDAPASDSTVTSLSTDPSVGSPGLSMQDITNLATGVLGVYQQYQLQQINLTRAQQGLPLISPDQFATHVQVGASSSTIAGGLGIAGIIGIAVVGAVLLSRK